jgi:L-fuculose-phosphate aldolase
MTSRWENQKRSVVAAAQRMAALGLVAGTSGNVSLRIPSGDSIDLMAVTPSGRPYDSLKADDIVIVDQDIEPVEGDLVPSSESILHSEIYRRRPDVGSVVHTHSVFASVAAVTVEEVPPIIDEMVVTVGGGIKVSSYAFPGSQELADSVCDALGDRNAAIIRHHGAVGVGRDLDEALGACEITERVAQIFVYASMLGEVRELPREIVEAEQAIFAMRKRAAGADSGTLK